MTCKTKRVMSLGKAARDVVDAWEYMDAQSPEFFALIQNLRAALDRDERELVEAKEYAKRLHMYRHEWKHNYAEQFKLANKWIDRFDFVSHKLEKANARIEKLEWALEVVYHAAYNDGENQYAKDPQSIIRAVVEKAEEGK